MSPIIKLYINQFLKAGTIFSAAFLLIDVIFEGWAELDAWRIFFQFLWFGTFWSLSTVSIHLYELKKLGVEKFTDDILSAKHEMEIQSQYSPAALLEQLRDDSFFGKMSISEKEDGIRLVRTIFWGASENIIKIEPMQKEHGTYSYRVQSYHRYNWGQLDYGNSLESILRLQKLLETKTVQHSMI